MMNTHRRAIELVLILMAAVLIVGVGAVLAVRDDSSSDELGGRGEMTATEPSTVTPASVTPTSSEATSTTTVVEGSPTATVTVPPDAAIQTEDQAIEAALDYARGVGAEDPRVVKVELLPLGDAVTTLKLGPGESMDFEEAGYDADEQLAAAWRVQLDNDEFMIDSCPPPDDATPGEDGGYENACPTEPTAILIFRASDAVLIASALGYQVPQ